jgi:hypothetical protein
VVVRRDFRTQASGVFSHLRKGRGGLRRVSQERANLAVVPGFWLDAEMADKTENEN